LSANGMREEPAVVADLVESAGLAVGPGEEQLEKPRIRPIPETKPVLAPLDTQERLDGPVDDEFVAQKPIGVELIEEERAVPIETFVLDEHGHIETAAGQVERIGIGIIFVSGIQFVKDQVESGQAAIDVRACEVEQMI